MSKIQLSGFMDSRYLILPIILFQILITLNPCKAVSTEYKGSLSTSSYYFKNSDRRGNDYIIETTRLKMAVYKINPVNSLKINLDVRQRLPLIKRDLNSKIPKYRYNAVNIEYKNPERDMYITTGRSIISEAGGAKIDGVKVTYILDNNYSIGLFGGFQPDVISDKPSALSSISGLYHLIKARGIFFNNSFIINSYKNGLDRIYYYSYLTYTPFKYTRFFYNINLDYNIAKKGIDITNLNLSSEVTPLSFIRLNIGYREFKPVTYNKRPNYFLDYKGSHAYFLGVNIDLSEDITTYSRVEYRLRSYINSYNNTVAREDKSSIYSYLGIKGSLNYLFNPYFDARFSFFNQAYAENKAYYLEIGKEITDSININGSYEVNDNFYDITKDYERFNTYSVNCEYITRSNIFYFFSYSYQEGNGAGYHTLFNKIGYRF